jgi:hypothetical protein
VLPKCSPPSRYLCWHQPPLLVPGLKCPSYPFLWFSVAADRGCQAKVSLQQYSKARCELEGSCWIEQGKRYFPENSLPCCAAHSQPNGGRSMRSSNCVWPASIQRNLLYLASHLAFRAREYQAVKSYTGCFDHWQQYLPKSGWSVQTLRQQYNILKNGRQARASCGLGAYRNAGVHSGNGMLPYWPFLWGEHHGGLQALRRCCCHLGQTAAVCCVSRHTLTTVV